jgi:cation/acetate symporter
MQNPRMAFGLLAIGFLLLVAILAGLESIGVRPGILGIFLAIFVLCTCLGSSIRTRTMDAAAFLRTRRRMIPAFDIMASSMNGVMGLLVAFLLAGGSLNDPGFTAIVSGWVGGLFLLTFLVAAPLRRSGAGTIPEFFALRFDSNLPRLSALVVLIAVSFSLFAAFIGLSAALLVQLVPVGHGTALRIVVGVLLVGTLFGGARSVSWTQAALFILFNIAVVIAIGWSLTGISPEPASPSAATPMDGEAALSFAALCAAMVAGTLSMPHIGSRSFTAMTAHSAGKSALWTMIIVSLAIIVSPALGFGGPGSAETPAFLGATMTAGALSASIALACGLLITMSNSIGHDLFARPGWGPETAPQRLFAKRAALVIVALAGGWMASSVPVEGVGEMVWAFAIAGAGLAVPLVGAIWWQRATAIGALVGMVAGIVTAIILLYAERHGGLAWAGLDPARIALAGIAANLVAFVGGSLLTEAPDETIVRRYRNLHLPETD